MLQELLLKLSYCHACTELYPGPAPLIGVMADLVGADI